MTTSRSHTLAATFLLAGALLHAQSPNTTSLVSITPARPLIGQVVTLTAQVSPASARGYVTFQDRGEFIGIAALNGAGFAVLNTVTLAVGSHTIRASYPGGNGYSPSQSALVSYTVAALPGTGFAAASNLAAGPDNWTDPSVAVADFNGDGRTDLAVASADNASTKGAVNVLLGNGDGTFQPPVGNTVGTGSGVVAVGDFNGDGIPDLAVATNGDNFVYIMLGNGDGTFQGAVAYGIGGIGPTAIAVGDFNLDGKVDLVVTVADPPGYAGVAAVLMGNGDGSFQPVKTYPSGTNPESVSVADFNGDGIADLVVINEGDNDAAILLGNGDGTFQAPFTAFAGPQPNAVAIGDFNGDGIWDLAVANGSSNNVAVLLGNGNGTFGDPVFYTCGAGPSYVAVSDFNGDGISDLVVANSQDDGVAVLQGNGDGTFQPILGYGPAGVYPPSLAVAGFNGNGVADLVVTSSFSNYVSVLIGLPLSATPSAVFLDATAQIGQLSVSAGPTYKWSATSAAPWLSIVSGAGIGNGSVTYAVTANTMGAPRTADLNVDTLSTPFTQRATAQIFTDVLPSAYYFDYADILYTDGITGGCLTSPPQFCPLDTVTRGEMAVFVVTAVMGGSNFTYTTTPYFADVPAGSPYFQFVQKLKDLGITDGCTATEFCPDNPVTRDEMAAFIIRARYETTPYTYPQAPYFSDESSADPFFPFVQKMAQDGITAGCAPNLYCPDATLTRGQMAVFIVTGLLDQLLPTGAHYISKASPNTAAPGQTVTVTLTGVNTNFAALVTQVTAAPGITVADLKVISPTSLTVQLTIPAGAAANPTSLIVNAAGQEADLPNGFIIQ